MILAPELDQESHVFEVDPRNSRVKLMEYRPQDLPLLSKRLVSMAEEQSLGKIIVYAHMGDVSTLQEQGFEVEGTIDGFRDGDPVCMMARFVDQERAISVNAEEKDRIVKMAKMASEKKPTVDLPEGFDLRPAKPEDAPSLAQLYKEVFTSYPTPIDQPEEIERAMEDEVYFSVVTHKEKIVSASSADVFPEQKVAEMTDCATLPAYRGKGLVSVLFSHLEERMRSRGIPNLFSLTRAVSVGMNVIAAKHGYCYRGRLVQNCHIAGQYEDMNIWVKTLE